MPKEPTGESPVQRSSTSTIGVGDTEIGAGEAALNWQTGGSGASREIWAYFMIVEVPIYREAVALEPALFAWGAKVPPAAHSNITSCAHQLRCVFLLSLKVFGT